MVDLIITRLITWNFLQPFWRALFKLSLRGMGVLNAAGDAVTGEQWLIDRLSRKKLGVVIDVGANTRVFGEQQLRASAIYAFEPHPKIFTKYLSKTPKKNQHGTKILLHNKAVGSKNGTVKLWDFADDANLKHTQPTSTLASLNPEVIEKLHGQKAQSFSIQCVTLDSFARKNKINSIDFLKIDVEGLELEVLKGAKNLLAANKIKLVQFEFNQMHAYQRVFFKDFIKMLPNYNLYRLSTNGLLPLGTYSPVTHELFAFQNIVGVLKSTPVRWL